MNQEADSQEKRALSRSHITSMDSQAHGRRLFGTSWSHRFARLLTNNCSSYTVFRLHKITTAEQQWGNNTVHLPTMTGTCTSDAFAYTCIRGGACDTLRFDYRLCAKTRGTMVKKTDPWRNSRATTTTIGGFSTETTRPAALRTDSSDRRRARAPPTNAHTLSRSVPLGSLSRRANCHARNLTRPIVNKSWVIL